MNKVNFVWQPLISIDRLDRKTTKKQFKAKQSKVSKSTFYIRGRINSVGRFEKSKTCNFFKKRTFLFKLSETFSPRSFENEGTLNIVWEDNFNFPSLTYTC